jgi:hypothetical protein
MKLAIKNLTKKKLGPLEAPLKGLKLKPGEVVEKTFDMKPKDFYNMYIEGLVRTNQIIIGRLE